MKVSKYNIKFNYLYRDSGNYKIFDYVIFRNRRELNLTYIDRKIKESLINGCLFYPVGMNVPMLSFGEDEIEGFPIWNEYESVEFTSELPTDKRNFLLN